MGAVRPSGHARAGAGWRPAGPDQVSLTSQRGERRWGVRSRRRSGIPTWSRALPADSQPRWSDDVVKTLLFAGRIRDARALADNCRFPKPPETGEAPRLM